MKYIQALAECNIFVELVKLHKGNIVLTFIIISIQTYSLFIFISIRVVSIFRKLDSIQVYFIYHFLLNDFRFYSAFLMHLVFSFKFLL